MVPFSGHLMNRGFNNWEIQSSHRLDAQKRRQREKNINGIKLWFLRKGLDVSQHTPQPPREYHVPLLYSSSFWSEGRSEIRRGEAMEDMQVIRLLQEDGIMAGEVFCDGCGSMMNLYKNRDTCIYKCCTCGMSQSARKGMSCENSRLPLQIIIMLISAWYDRASLATASTQASITAGTGCR